MPTFSGGGATFNGGTITLPLDIEVNQAAGTDLFKIRNTAGGAGSTPLRVTRTAGGANALVVGTVGFSGDTKIWANWDNDSDPTFEVGVGGAAGVVMMVNLPTADPHNAGQLWADTVAKAVKYSTG